VHGDLAEQPRSDGGGRRSGQPGGRVDVGAQDDVDGGVVEGGENRGGGLVVSQAGKPHPRVLRHRRSPRQTPRQGRRR